MTASLAALVSLALAGAAVAASPRDVFVPTAGGNHVAYFPVGATSSNSLSVAGAHRIAITPDGSKAYVATNTSTVSIIDTATPSVNASSATLPTAGTNIAISPDGTTAYVGNGTGASNNVYVIRLSDNHVTTIDNVDEPDLVALSPDGSKLYVVSFIAATGPTNSVLRIRNTSDGSMVGNPVVLGDFTTFPNGIAVAPDGNELYTANTNGTVSAVDLTTTPDPTVNTITGFSDASALAITPDGSEVYVTNGSAANVSVIDTATDTVETGTGLPISVGLSPAGVFFTPDGDTAYVANSNAAGPGPVTVTPIDTATKAPAAGVPVGTFPGDGPMAVAIVPDQGPTASFSDTPAQAGSATSFDASTSSDPESTVASYHWNFGDSATADTSTPTTTHTYATGGSYTVTLTVTDDEGCSNTFIYTGQTASCNPNNLDPAQTSSMVAIPAAPSGGGGGGAPTPAPTATGQRAAALKKCKKKKSAKARKKCKVKANKLPL
jgi:YVTN family beta-propeller protein